MLLAMVGQWTHYPGGSNEGKEWGYRFTGWKAVDESGDTDLERMESEFDRARKIMNARYIKVRQTKEDRGT